MNISQILELARKHINNSSSVFCMKDADKAVERGDFKAARMWALNSMEYSVGVFHPDYKIAKSL